MQEYILIQLIKRANRIPDFKMTVHQQEKLFVFLCSTIVLILDSPYFFSISFLLIPWLCVCYLQMIHNYMEHLERTKHQHAVTTAEPSDTSTSTRIRWVVSPVISWIKKRMLVPLEQQLGSLKVSNYVDFIWGIYDTHAVTIRQSKFMKPLSHFQVKCAFLFPVWVYFGFGLLVGQNKLLEKLFWHFSRLIRQISQ